MLAVLLNDQAGTTGTSSATPSLAGILDQADAAAGGTSAADSDLLTSLTPGAVGSDTSASTGSVDSAGSLANMLDTLDAASSDSSTMVQSGQATTSVLDSLPALLDQMDSVPPA
jgi:hypothetical protein